jgi:hypothetical protein
MLRECSLRIEVVSEEEFANDLSGDPFKERHKLPERATAVARNNGRGKLRVKRIVLVNVPELLRVLEVSYSNVTVLGELGSGAGEFTVLVTITFDIGFDPLTDLRHQRTNIFYGELLRRCPALSCFLLRQLSHLL